MVNVRDHSPWRVGPFGGWPWPALMTYGVLTLLCCGLFALDSGPWQDGAASLGSARRAETKFAGGYLAEGRTPTRRLKSVVFAAAIRSPDPFAAIQIVAVILWLGQGLVADRLARALFGGGPMVGLMAGALTLCATSDFLTGSAVGLAYQMSMLAFLTALLGLIQWCRTGNRLLLAVSAVLVSASVWSSDGVLTSIALTPLLAAVLPQLRRRAIIALLVWGVVLIPYAVLFWIEFRNPAGYAQIALVSLTPGEWLTRSWTLFAHNFTPWRWLQLPPLFTDIVPARYLPDWIYWGGAGVGTVVFLSTAWTHARWRDRPAPVCAPATGIWAALVYLALMTLSVNAMFAMVHVSEGYYRTHLVSRVWASLLISGGLALLIRRSPRGVVWTLPPLAAFVFLGIWSGLSRQDYFLSVWREHRPELSSIVENAPRLRPETSLILYANAPGFQATEVNYLAQHWMTLLYDDPSMLQRTVLWSPDRHAGCTAGESGFVCWLEGQHECVMSGECAATEVGFHDAVVMRFAPGQGRYELVDDLSTLPVTLPPAAKTYAPQLNIERGPAPANRSALLTESRLLGRWLTRPVVPAHPWGAPPAAEGSR